MGRPAADSRGSATVEFALVLPLVLMMALVVLQVGLFAKDELVAAGSARAGARQAAVSSDDAAAVQAAIDAAAGFDPSRLVVEIIRGPGVGSDVAVTVTYHAPVSIPVVGWLFPASIDVAGTATMRQEAT